MSKYKPKKRAKSLTESNNTIQYSKRAKRRTRGKRRKFEREEKQMRYDIWDNRCAYCNTKKSEMTADHFVPLHIGGKACDRLDNIIPACNTCNNAKGCKNAWEWYSRQQFFDLSRWQKILSNVKDCLF